MSVATKVESVTPQIAEKYLALSAGNRTISDAGVLSLAVEMDAGRWQAHASEIVFDDEGALIDGHHRLRAVVLSGRAVEMSIKRGVPRAARAVIDTGRQRSLKDLFNMYRGDETNVNNVISALRNAATLLVGTTVKLRISTLGAADAWMRQFKDGIEWVIPASVTGTRITDRFRVGPVTGAFAFAHKMNPKRVEMFHTSVVGGVGLESGSPALVLRNFIMGAAKVNSGGQRHATALKVLNAINAELRGFDVSVLSVVAA